MARSICWIPGLLAECISIVDLVHTHHTYLLPLLSKQAANFCRFNCPSHSFRTEISKWGDKVMSQSESRLSSWPSCTQHWWVKQPIMADCNSFYFTYLLLPLLLLLLLLLRGVSKGDAWLSLVEVLREKNTDMIRTWNNASVQRGGMEMNRNEGVCVGMFII